MEYFQLNNYFKTKIISFKNNRKQREKKNKAINLTVLYFVYYFSTCDTTYQRLKFPALFHKRKLLGRKIEFLKPVSVFNLFYSLETLDSRIFFQVKTVITTDNHFD
jgi:hypothetical protein